MNDLQLLFEKGSGNTMDAGAGKLELQKDWWFLREEIPGLQMTGPTDYGGLEKFGQEVIKKNKSLLEEMEALQ